PPAKTGSRAHTRTPSPPPSPPDQTARDPPHPSDTPHESDPSPSGRRHQAPSTPNDPPAATPPTTAASTTTDHGQHQRILKPCQKCLKPVRQHQYSSRRCDREPGSGI